MDFLVEFGINVPEGTPETEVKAREHAESAAAAKLVDEGHLVRLWNRRVAPGESRPIGLYRAESEGELDRLLRALPLYEWMRVSVTSLEPHPNDPAARNGSAVAGSPVHNGNNRERKRPCHSSKSERRTPPTSKSTTTITAPASRSS
jgi:muconolactone D-isomerase